MSTHCDGRRLKQGLMFALPICAAPLLGACYEAVTIAEWPEGDAGTVEVDAGLEASDEDAGPSIGGGAGAQAVSYADPSVLAELRDFRELRTTRIGSATTESGILHDVWRNHWAR